MSLLIEALRKAEASREKLNTNPETAAEVREAMRLEPIDLDLADLPPAAPRPVPNPPPQMAAAEPRPRRPAAAQNGGAEAQARENARQLFGAKQLPNGPSIALLAVGIGIFLAALGGAYVWWQTRPSGLGASPLAVVPPPETVPAEPRAAAPAMPLPPPAARPAPPSAEPGKKTAIVTHAPRVTDDKEQPPPAPLSEEGPAIHVRRTAAQNVAAASSPVEAGYAAYQKGDLATARARYLDGLQRDPQATDALDGLGAIALRQGQNEEAERWFRKSLTANPRNPVAQSGLITATREPDLTAAESRLNTMLREQPDSAATHFTLGNVLARSGRWADAQQAYFKAYSLEPENPDTLFNLAVALDQLGQGPLARDFYSRALAAALKHPATFDQPAAARRLQSLTPR